MIVFVNGIKGGWAPPAGRPYWTEPETPFVIQAGKCLGDSVTWFPVVRHRWFSHAEDRYSLGYAFCQSNMDTIASIVKAGDTIKFIAHSMGCSFAEGMAACLLERGYTVNAMIHINAFQAADMKANEDIGCTIDYQYTDDLIIRIPLLSHAGNIKGAVTLREVSHLSLRRRHRGPVYPRSTMFWKTIAPHLNKRR